VKRIAEYFAAFCIAAALMLALLVGAACIPRGAIEGNMRESARFLAAGETYPLAVPGVDASRIDRYADAILLNIAWHYDAAKPLRSVMLSAYRHAPNQNVLDSLLDAVTNDQPANQQYLRYWHGSIAVVRPLLAVLSLRQIYVFNGVLLAALAALLTALLLRRRAWFPAAGMLAGMIAAAFWFVPLSLEYTWTCLLALIWSLFVLRLADRGKWERAGVVFLISGMVTSFLDFLTTETLSLLVPLLLLIWLRRRADAAASPVRTAWTAAVPWCCGYVGMWLLKWLLAGAVLGENVLPYVTEHIDERLSGEVAGIGPIRLVSGAIWRNVFCLFPLGWGVVGALTGLALLVGAAYVGFVYLQKGCDKRLILTYALLGLVPYARYLTLRNHSFLHFFFTYRAQMASVLAAALILDELTKRRRGNVAKRRKHA